MFILIVLVVFGFSCLGMAIWSAWVGVQQDSPAMAIMTVTLLLMACGFVILATSLFMRACLP